MFRVLRTNSVLRRVRIAHPAIRRLQTSRTMARYRKPAEVGM
jgi:hypothetical protein